MDNSGSVCKQFIVTRLPVGEIIEIKKLADGSFRVVQRLPGGSKKDNVVHELSEVSKKGVSKTKISDDDLILIDAENLSMQDAIMQYKPLNLKEEVTYELISETINEKVKNFYISKYGTKLTDDGEGICFIPGKRSAVGKSYDWNSKAAKEFMPERNSRLGTILQYGAFLGVLIKKLVEEGKSVKWAWNAVCNNASELENYWNCNDFVDSKVIAGFHCFANFKMLAEEIDTGGYWVAGGGYSLAGKLNEYANLYYIGYREFSYEHSEGWVVFS